MLLTLVPREPRFAVRLPLRMSREGTVPFQVALPKDFHDKLRIEVAGSLNHALIALARQALTWLDAEQSRLRIDPDKDPLTAQVRRQFTHSDWSQLWSYPHPMFREEPREGTVVVSLDGRPSRSGAVYVQIGLPPDLQKRLHEQGVGSVGQLLVYLARHALVRLEAMRLSLHVTEEPDASTDNLASPRTRVSAGDPPSSTASQLVRQLQSYPPETPVTLSSTVSGSSISLAEERNAAGEIVLLVLSASE
jgi:hypothetical protein